MKTIAPLLAVGALLAVPALHAQEPAPPALEPMEAPMIVPSPGAPDTPPPPGMPGTPANPQPVNPPPTEPVPAPNPAHTPETRRALDLEAQANVVLYFAGGETPEGDNAGTFYIAKPDPNPDAVDPTTRQLSIGKLKPLPMRDLGNYLQELDLDKDLAVVVLNKTAQHWPEHVLIDATDRMTSAFRAAGFQRVVYEFDSGNQRKVYYDTAS